MDFNMPGKDGIEACAELRRDGVQAPIALLTGNNSDEIKKRGLAAGASTCLTKPFHLTDLDALIAPLECPKPSAAPTKKP
jgi:DNA-binding response OmpR family regulator